MGLLDRKEIGFLGKIISAIWCLFLLSQIFMRFDVFKLAMQRSRTFLSKIENSPKIKNVIESKLKNKQKLIINILRLIF